MLLFFKPESISYTCDVVFLTKIDLVLYLKRFANPFDGLFFSKPKFMSCTFDVTFLVESNLS